MSDATCSRCGVPVEPPVTKSCASVNGEELDDLVFCVKCSVLAATTPVSEFLKDRADWPLLTICGGDDA